MSYDYDLVYAMRGGAKKPLRYALDAGSGKTTQIQSSPQATFTLFDNTGATVTGYPVNVTTYDTRKIQKPTIWYFLDTLNPTVLAESSVYIGRLGFTHIGSDA